MLTPERLAALRPGPLQGRQGEWQPLQGAFADVRLVWTCLQYAYQINNELKGNAGACLSWSRMMKQARPASTVHGGGNRRGYLKNALNAFFDFRQDHADYPENQSGEHIGEGKRHGNEDPRVFRAVNT
jgi:hypothetical protein